MDTGKGYIKMNLPQIKDHAVSRNVVKQIVFQRQIVIRINAFKIGRAHV